MVREALKCGPPLLRVRAEKVLRFGQRLPLEPEPQLTAGAGRTHQPRPLEHVQMLGHRLAADRCRVAQLLDRTRLSVGEPLNELEPRRIPNCTEDNFPAT